MPIRSRNASATFQRFMNVVMSGLSVDVLLVHIIVHSTDLPSQLERLEFLFQGLRWAELKLKISEYSLLRKEVSFLGHRISEAGVYGSGQDARCRRLGCAEQCQRDKETRSFMGLYGYYRRFVPDFSTIAALLHELTKKNRPFVWDAQCQRTCQVLKEKLITAPILDLPRDDCRIS